MMKIVLALTALIAMAQAIPAKPRRSGPWGPPWFCQIMFLPARLCEKEENRMGPEMKALIETRVQFCKDVASGNDEAAWAIVDRAIAFQCVSYLLFQYLEIRSVTFSNSY